MSRMERAIRTNDQGKRVEKVSEKFWRLIPLYHVDGHIWKNAEKTHNRVIIDEMCRKTCKQWENYVK